MVAVWRINSLAHEWAREICQEAIAIVQMRYGGDGSGDREKRTDLTNMFGEKLEEQVKHLLSGEEILSKREE